MALLRLRSLLFLLIFTLFCHSSRAQKTTSKNTLYVGVRGNYGFLWAHRPTMSHLVNRHIAHGEISIWKITKGEKCWHEPYFNPQAGITCAVIPLGDERLGTAIGLFPYISFPLYRSEKKAVLHFQLGWGFGWITNKFDPIENHKNIAIGSHLNACINLRGTGLFKISDNLYLEGGIGLMHFSNGAFTLPNLGINIPTVQAGIHFRICGDPVAPCVKDDPQKFSHTDSLIYNPKWHFTAVVVTGANDIDPPGGSRYGLCNVLMTMMKNNSRKHRFGGGIDIMYSHSLLMRMRNDEMQVTPLQNVQVGAKFSYELVIGRLYLPFEMGVYAYSKFKEHGPVYNRLAVRYLVNDHFICNVSLKTHFARAEYWEAGIGWRI